MESAKRLITPSAMMEEHYGTGVGAQKAPWADSSIPISASEARGFDRRSYVKGAIGALALCCAVVGAVLAYTGQLSTQLGVAGSRLGAISQSSIQSPGEPMKFTVDFTCVPADVRALASTKSPYSFDFSKVVGAKLIVKEMQPELWFRTGVEMTKVKNGVFTVQTNKVGEHDEYGFALYTNEIAYRFGKWEGPKIPRHFFEMGGVSDVGRCSNVTAGKNPCMRAAPLAIADRHPDPHGGCVVNVGGSGFYNRIMYPSQKRQDNYWVFGTCMSKCPGAASSAGATASLALPQAHAVPKEARVPKEEPHHAFEVRKAVGGGVAAVSKSAVDNDKIHVEQVDDDLHHLQALQRELHETLRHEKTLQSEILRISQKKIA